MGASKPTPSLSQIRRELEEILALLGNGYQSDRAPRPAQPEGDQGSGNNLKQFDSGETSLSAERDQLFDDALVVITEFGNASPSILQMWLSIDYTRATLILSQLEAEGLVSPKGKVRHKAFELRRSC